MSGHLWRQDVEHHLSVGVAVSALVIPHDKSSLLSEIKESPIYFRLDDRVRLAELREASFNASRLFLKLFSGFRQRFNYAGENPI